MRTLNEIMGNEEDLGAFLIRCRMDVKFFAERVMGLEMMPYHLFWLKSFLTKRRCCITAPRSSGKTYTLGVLFPIWVSIFQSDKRFLIVAASKDKAQDIVKELRDAIEGNELLNALLTPTGKSTLWSTTEMKTKTNCKFVVRAYTGKGVRGNHVDYCLLDEGGEIEGRETNLFFDGITPTVNHRNGHIMVIGTPKTEIDLLSTLNEPQRGYFCRTYSIWDEENDKSMWPSKFGRKKLEKIKNEVGNITFRREYMCERIDEGVQPFKMADIVRSYDKNLPFKNTGAEYVQEDGAKVWGQYFIGVDLAMSPQGDYSVYTVVELVDGKVVVRRIQREKGIHYKTQEIMVKQLWEDFQPMRIVVDKSVFGDIFISDLRDMGIPAEPFTFTPDNRNRILNNLMRIFENELITIPRDTEDSDCMYETTNLTDELQKILFDHTPSGQRTFKSVGKHDDSVMGLALAAYAATEYGESITYVDKIMEEDNTIYAVADNNFFVEPPIPDPIEPSF